MFNIYDFRADLYSPKLIESTILDGFAGVSINNLSERIDEYDGDIWWLPLRPCIKCNFNSQKFTSFLMNQENKKYDKWGAIRAGLDFWDRLPLLRNLTRSKEDFRRLYCSELATGALEVAGVIKKINASEVTPSDLCKMKIFDEKYIQLAGKKPRKINGYNTRES